MIKPDSILRRLPSGLDRKQALFIDGIRHSGEIASFAYERLKRVLTQIASEETPQSERGALFTPAFLDAWAVVDAIDRFRGLYKLFPGAQLKEGDKSDEKARDTLQKIRDVRNVTDHMAQLMDHILSRKSAALGMLSWCTMVSVEQGRCLSCSIIPGTLGRQSAPTVNPAGRDIELPTGLISLSAGEHSADLSDAMSVMTSRVKDIETQIEKFVNEHKLDENQAGADLFISLLISFDTSSEAKPRQDHTDA
ncbi:MAG: hypothetical protein IPM63_13415 [Acidobacteriota bacterium]|nr:MAG: hypothetical protein IPM63_13415 [Acidobacteriota bacterium]